LYLRNRLAVSTEPANCRRKYDLAEANNIISRADTMPDRTRITPLCALLALTWVGSGQSGSLDDCSLSDDTRNDIARYQDHVDGIMKTFNCYARLFVLQPRRNPCTSHSRFKNTAFYLTVLLLMTSGDVEPNPGPPAATQDEQPPLLMPPPSESRHTAEASQPVSEPTSSQHLSDSVTSETASLSATPPECHRCHTINRKKRSIRCSHCESSWHLSCVKLRKAQADALSCWWCPDCTSFGYRKPQVQDQAPSQSPDVTQTADPGLAVTLAQLKRTRTVIRRIPRGARIPASQALTTLIETAVSDGTWQAWSRLLQFPHVTLSVPRNLW